MSSAISAARQPRGLYVLFFSEMWERFSYYGMRALLVLYLVNALELPRERALEIYATYTALVYFTPLIGGYLADRWLGARRAVLAGGLIMATGHFAMAVPAALYFALGLLIAGNGFFKPNISTLVGTLYRQGDTRRDSGFTIFYMGINLGAFIAPLLCGTLGEKLGWHFGFATAGFGMLAGLAVFALGQRRVAAADGAPVPITARDWRMAGATWAVVAALVALAVALGPRLLSLWQAADSGSKIGLAAGLAALALLASRAAARRRGARVTAPDGGGLSRIEIRRMLAILIMAVFVVFFWMGFEQAGGTMNLFADRQTDRVVLGWEMPASYFQAVNPLLILLLGPLFSLLWTRLDGSRFALSTVAKQGLGMIILGLGFVVLAIAAGRAELVGKVGPAWLLAVYLFHTMGELCLSPIGLSMVTKLAPARFAALMMGIWFTAMALANFLAGTLESLLQGTGMPLYWFLVASSIGAGAVLLLLSPLIGRLMHGVR